MTTNKDISAIIDRMYSIRSQIRGLYINSNNDSIYTLEDNIKSSISSLIKNKGNIEINIREFSINISFNEELNISNRTMQTIYCRIDSILRDYIKSKSTNNDILQYIDNLNNSIVDYYQVGNCLKFLL